MGTVEFAFSLMASALVAAGLGLMIWPIQMARLIAMARRKSNRRLTADEIAQKRILGFAIAAIGVFMLYMIASHHVPDSYWGLAR